MTQVFILGVLTLLAYGAVWYGIRYIRLFVLEHAMRRLQRDFHQALRRQILVGNDLLLELYRMKLIRLQRRRCHIVSQILSRDASFGIS